MLRQHATADTSSTATTPVVTVDPVSDAHRALHPGLLDNATHVIALYRKHQLADVDPVVGPSPDTIPLLRARAPKFAAAHGATYWEPCGYCGINCTPADRAEHDRYARTSETTYRTRWAT
jgi:hypothetical protein